MWGTSDTERCAIYCGDAQVGQVMTSQLVGRDQTICVYFLLMLRRPCMQLLSSEEID